MAYRRKCPRKALGIRRRSGKKDAAAANDFWAEAAISDFSNDEVEEALAGGSDRNFPWEKSRKS
jgi:hypothetical protein